MEESATFATGTLYDDILRWWAHRRRLRLRRRDARNARLRWWSPPSAIK